MKNITNKSNDLNDIMTKIRNGLPALPRIIGKYEYFNSAVMILLLEINSEIHILFQKRASQIRQGGEICFPGGEFDEAQDCEFYETALRETSEELGIPTSKIELLGSLGTVVASMGATVDVFVGFTDIAINKMEINCEEVEAVFSIPLSYFIGNLPESYYTIIKSFPKYIDETTREEIVLLPSEALGLPERYHKPWGRFRQKVYVYKTENEVIWGLTARILFDFIEVIGA